MKTGTLVGVRVAAFFLIAGGLLGLIVSGQMGMHFAPLHDNAKLASVVLGLALFLFSIYTGIELWRLRSRGLRWARVLFALQIPQVSLFRLTFEYSTFFSLRAMIGNTTHRIGANLGASCNIYWLSQPVGWMLGINLVAIVILLFLLRAPRTLSFRD